MKKIITSVQYITILKKNTSQVKINHKLHIGLISVGTIFK